MQVRLGALTVGLALFVVGVATSCEQAPETEPATPTPTNPLQGVWSVTAIDPGDGSAVIDPSQPGLYIFAKGYYSAVFAREAEARAPAATAFSPTPEEMVAQYESIIVNTGTYEISGSTVTFRPIIAKSPGFVVGQSTFEFEISGNVLTLSETSTMAADGTAAPGANTTMTLRRVE